MEQRPEISFTLRDMEQLYEIRALASRYHTSPGKILLACMRLAKNKPMHELQDAVKEVILDFNPKAEFEIYYLLLVEANGNPHKLGELFQEGFPYRENEYYAGVSGDNKVESTMQGTSLSSKQLDWLLEHSEVHNWDVIRRTIQLEEPKL